MWIIPKLFRIQSVCHKLTPSTQCTDIGTGDDTVAPGEKWYAFDAEQEKVIEKHISFR